MKSKSIGGVKFNVQYRPSELMMLNEWKDEGVKSESSYDSILSTYSNSYYFLLEIEAEQGGNIEEQVVGQGYGSYTAYKSIVENLSFSMSEHVELICGYDTLSPSLYHFERGYELGNKMRFLFAFIKPEARVSEFTFSYKDEMFHASRLNYIYDLDQLDIPVLSDIIK